jgi:hypothetical protein
MKMAEKGAAFQMAPSTPVCDDGVAYRAGKSDTRHPVFGAITILSKVSVAYACTIAVVVTAKVDCDYDLNCGDCE